MAATAVDIRSILLAVAVFTTASVALMTISAVSPASAAMFQPAEENLTISVTLRPFEDGWVDVTMEASLPGEAFVVLPLAGEPDALLVTNGEGVPLSYSLGDGAVVVEAVGERQVVVSYQTPSLTRKVGGVWEFSVDLPGVSELEVHLPADAVIVGLSPVPEEVNRGSDLLVISFKGGTANVSYAFESSPGVHPASSGGSSGLSGGFGQLFQGTPLYILAGAAVGAIILIALLVARARQE